MKASAVLIVALHILFTPACTRATVKGTGINYGQQTQALNIRQEEEKGVVENEARDGACKETMFFFLRGSTQQSNMVRTILQPLVFMEPFALTDY